MKPNGTVTSGPGTLDAGTPWTTADVNGDGLPDLVVSWFDPAKLSNHVSVALNQGSSFGP